MSEEKLGLTACYYNPCKFKRRLHNFLKFHEAVGDQIRNAVWVELAFDDQEFDLSHLPNVIQMRTNTLVWQKEALLNIGLRKLLEKGYENVCWLDADISFEN